MASKGLDRKAASAGEGKRMLILDQEKVIRKFAPTLKAFT
jgi:hypothetical protein